MRVKTRAPYVRRYLAGQSLSILGDTSLWLALAIWVRELTGSNALAGLSFFFISAPQLFGPVWGTFIDRVARRPVLIGVNLAGAALTLALLAVHNRHQVWLIWAVLVGYGIVGSSLSSAQSGFLRTLLPDDGIGEAQAWLTTVREGLRLFSPLIGAGLFAVAGGHAVALIDTATFLIAAITVATIHVEEVIEPRPPQQKLRTEIAAGWAHITDTVRIRQVVISLFTLCMVVGITETTTIAVVTTGLHRSATWLGPFEALMGVGGIAGGITVSRGMRRLGEGRACALGIITCAVGCGLLCAPNLIAVVPGIIGLGLGVPWLIVPANTVVMRLTPNPLQGRVAATVDVLTGPPQALSIALGAGLIGVLGYQPLLGLVGVVMALVGGWLYTRPEQRGPLTTTDDSAGPELETALAAAADALGPITTQPMNAAAPM